MATYEEIYGKRVDVLSSDPSLTSANEGQVWYNSTTGTLKTVVAVAAWSSGTILPGNRTYIGGAGSQTAALGFGGAENPPGTAQSGTFEFNGSGWANGGDLPAASDLSGGMGTQTAALKTFGRSGGPVTAEAFEYDGSTWTAGGDGGTARWGVGSAGTQTAGLAFGGFTTPPHTWYDNTEEYDGSSWSEVADLSTARSQVGFLGDGQTSALCVGGETPPSFGAVNTVEGWNGSVWASETNYPGVSQGGVGTGSESDGYFFTPSPNSTNSFSYDGSAWTAGASLGSGRSNGSRAGTTTAALAFGGNNGSGGNFVEEYNFSVNTVTASAWAAGNAMNTARRGTCNSGSGIQAAAIVAGGNGSQPGTTLLNNSEEFDGTSWAEGDNLNTAGTSRSGAGIQTAALAIGGYTGSYPEVALTEEYNGSSWSEDGDMATGRRKGGAGGTAVAAIYAGGNSGSPTTYYANAEYYNGSSWTNAPANMPTSRAGGCGVGTQTAFLMVGGVIPPGPPFTITNTGVEWDGSSWTASGTYPFGQGELGNGGGTLTAALFAGGTESPNTASTGYDGTSFSTRPSIATGRSESAGLNGGSSSAAAGLIASGPTGSVSALTEEFTGVTETVTAKTLTTS